MMRSSLFDPLRKIEVACTPEEEVRQWMISILKDNLGVPPHLMMSEAGFKAGEKQYRADILVYDRNAQPLLVVECKRPSVELDANVAFQALKYDSVLAVRYIILTNGNTTFFFRRQADRFVQSPRLLTYDQMIDQCQQ